MFTKRATVNSSSSKIDLKWRSANWTLMLRSQTLYIGSFYRNLLHFSYPFAFAGAHIEWEHCTYRFVLNAINWIYSQHSCGCYMEIWTSIKQANTSLHQLNMILNASLLKTARYACIKVFPLSVSNLFILSLPIRLRLRKLHVSYFTMDILPQ